MRSLTIIAALALAVWICLPAAPARAGAHGVGLGVAAGLAFSPTELDRGSVRLRDREKTTFSWGFFVDIPLLSTFYIAPAAMLYELDLGEGPKPVTDIDLNFKFIVPISDARLGVGLTAGVTNAEEKYAGHYGLLGFFSYNLVANLDAFLLAQYKKLVRDKGNIDDVHGYLGGMFYF